MGSPFSRGLILIFCSLFLVLLGQCRGQLAPDGTNVCSTRISYSQNYRQSFQVSIKLRSIYKCGFWNLGNCTRYRTIYETNYRIGTRISFTKQYHCCKGWSQVGHQCTKALCSPSCVNGTCTKPDYCSCASGYYGKLCDRDCPVHKWGPRCRYDCLCQNNAECSSHTGTCTCTPGWEGRYCNKTCDQGYYGNKCQKKCDCVNGATCDPINGYCTCAAGYRGERCQFTCPLDWYGKNCGLRCECQNGASCNHVNGTCKCQPGYLGQKCERLCKDDILGRECRGICACRNNATCSSFGFCNCTSGYTGMLCETQCFADQNGCLKQCNCSEWGDCNPYSGFCACQPGYIGKTCDTQCSDGQYGPGCIGVCNCQNNATCSKVDCSCDCLPGWTGVECNNPCPAGYHGKNCQSKCQCQNGATCDPVTGHCTCVGAWQGEYCNTRKFPRKGYQSEDMENVLLPSVLSGAGLILVVIFVAFGVIMFRKHQKSRSKKRSNIFSGQEKEEGVIEYSNTRDERNTRKRRRQDKQSNKLHKSNDSLSNADYQSAYQQVNRNLRGAEAGKGIHSNQDHADYQPLKVHGKEEHAYQGLTFKDPSTSEPQTPPVYDDNVIRARDPEDPEPLYEVSQTEETYITLIS